MKRYGSVEALRGVSLQIEQGEFFALLGPNGAGKTTLISIIAGLTRASGGAVRVMGHDVVADYRQARRQLGVVPQELVFDPFFSVRESLQISSGYYGVRNNEGWIDEILESLGLASKAKANMRALSGGHEATSPGRASPGASAAGHRPRRTDCRRRRGIAPVAVGFHPAAQPGRAHHRPDHPLPGGGPGVVPAGSDAQGGRIVALDTTASLLKRFAGGALVLSLSGAPLPSALQSRVVAGPADDPRLHLEIHRFEEVEFVLATLREAGCVIEDMEIARTDLEDVFVNVMNQV
jgi:ABC-2 type transport system ATP-binding protein